MKRVESMERGRPARRAGFSITFLCLFPFLLLMSCAAREQKNDRVVLDLLEDFRYAEQSNSVATGVRAFSVGQASIKGKKFESLIQNQSAGISFYASLLKNPVLKFYSKFAGDPIFQPAAGVLLESDYPSYLKQDFPVKGEEQEIDISPFQHRVTRITFYARGRDPEKFNGQFLWMKPHVEEYRNAAPAVAASLEALRARHKYDNVLIFVFDATNPLHLGCFGYPRNTSPVIDSLAADGILWEKAFALAPYTLASTGSLLVGVYPDIHRVLGVGDKLPEQFHTMAESFRDAGYQTGMFLATPNATPLFGYTQGFQRVWDPARVISADEIASAVNVWLERVREKHFFAYIHFREPHLPYTPPAEFVRRFRDEPDFHVPHFEFTVPPSAEDKSRIIDAYDANMAFGDSQLGKILSDLKVLKLWEKTMIIVLSDHGEAFWEHQIQGHNLTLYDEMLHIPFIVRLPHEPRFRHIRRSELVSNIDVFPTLSDLFQFSRRGTELSGESLLPYVAAGAKQDSRILISERYGGKAYALRSSDVKYIRKYDGDPDEFYFLSKDPSESKNLLKSYPISSAFYRLKLQKMREQFQNIRNSMQIQQPKAILDKETEETMRALGYLN